MKVKLSKSADRFLTQLDPKIRNSVLAKIGILKTCLEIQKIYPPEKLDIKKLKGNLEGFSRIRVGKIRVIFQISKEADEIYIYDIAYRGDIYDK
jgi:mRNA-degrading endonuclease RelE of RelBE toxin-antitoxin system